MKIVYAILCIYLIISLPTYSTENSSGWNPPSEESEEGKQLYPALGLELESIFSKESNELLSVLEECKKSTFSRTIENISDASLNGDVLPENLFEAELPRYSEAVYSGRLLFQNSDEWVKALKAHYAVINLLIREEPKLFEVLAERAAILPPTYFDVLLGWTCLDGAGPPFNNRDSSSMIASWNAMLNGKNPIYRLVAVKLAPRFANGPESLMKTYSSALREDDVVIQFKALEGLSRHVETESLDVIRDFLSETKHGERVLHRLESTTNIAAEAAAVAQKIESKIASRQEENKTDNSSVKPEQKKLSLSELIGIMKTGNDEEVKDAIARFFAKDCIFPNYRCLWNGPYPTKDESQALFSLLEQVPQPRAELILTYGLMRLPRRNLNVYEQEYVNHFISYLKEQLDTEAPLVSISTVIECLGRSVYLDDLWIELEGGRDFVPYNNSEIISIFLSLLESEKPDIRIIAASWLGKLGANDITISDDIMDVLRNRLQKTKNPSHQPNRMKEITLLENMIRSIDADRRNILHVREKAKQKKKN